ncbi:unannotated protein [freshwater metagenome]|uniref:Unannotated protein n=1 Tax=freshwater metagenome TaxID=449393 RepID=A0A6J5YSU7_9ZZZZ|nr:DUF3027 domain-containing protein [Actinomycetota bacterium]MSV63603.1 DUF3027 domain-containing protein [Actinomycetota bacterium]MSW26764.1 DUF3027 domain-containing protein [Actinomycetota bacterium]MSW34310.1 DUF3027 domain-containing protein [Actinomycetota bacterium]MSX31679.1 DUF3027 domain-containing protein [Actinomycetota bacterium]
MALFKRTPKVQTFDALDLARSAVLEDAGDPKLVGEYVSVDFDDEGRIASYLFEALLPAYKGWRWVVTIAKTDATSAPTVCDVVVLPGPDSLLAPAWIPYVDRLQPGDVGVGDVVPSSIDDARLVPGIAALPADEDLDATQIWDLGLGRARVMSIEGRDQASKRWYTGDRGPESAMAKAAPKPCASCGFFIPISGSLRAAFGACANAISPEDGRVVSVDHGCGAHSEATL